MSKDEREAQIARSIATLDTIEANMERPSTVGELKVSLANLEQVEALLDKAGYELGDQERSRLSDRLSAVKTKNKRKLNALLPWPLVIFTNIPLSKDKCELVELLDHPVYWVRKNAARSIKSDVKKIVEDPEKAKALINALLGLCMNPDADVRWCAADLLLRIPREVVTHVGLVAETVGRLQDALRDSECEIRLTAVRGLLLYQPNGYRELLEDLSKDDPNESVRCAAQQERGETESGKQEEHCVVCTRFAPKERLHLLNVYSPNACDDYQMAVGCSNPFLNVAAIPVPPRNSFDAAEWTTVRDQAKADWIDLVRSQRNEKPDWAPSSWLVCRQCVVALNISGQDAERALEESRKHFRGEPAIGVLTAEGSRFKQQVESKCFVCTVAFGDASMPQVQAYREFRDNCLDQWSIGRYIIRLYYHVGPTLASFVAGKPRIRLLVRRIFIVFLPCIKWLVRGSRSRRRSTASKD